MMVGNTLGVASSGESGPLHPGGAVGDIHSAAVSLNLLQFLNALLTRRRAVVGFPLLAALAATVVSLILRPTFTATTTFVPETRGRPVLPASIAGLAGQLGLSVGTNASESPRFYAQVAKSRELLERILLTRFPDPRTSGQDSTRLLEILKVRGRNSLDSLQDGVKELSKLVSTRVDLQTNIVTLSVESRYPGLASAVANTFIDYINDFNTKTRQFQARERRKFVEQRLVEGERQLRVAEDDLKRFYELNRSWQQSPQLTFEEIRLRGQVDIQKELYLTLRREYETARIEEVNDTPVITVIDAAVRPQKKSSPRRGLIVLLTFVLAGIGVVSWAVGAEYFERSRRDEEEEYRRLIRLLEALRDEARGAWRKVFRRGSR
jgi:tyrosine-protein kinase Etk/Wzc